MGVTLKLATSLDGRIATATGESRWITGEEARAAVHRLRAEHDAVLVGIETALADDPELTVRTPGYAGPQPARVVLDSRGRLPATSKLARTAGAVAVYQVTLASGDAPPSTAFGGPLPPEREDAGSGSSRSGGSTAEGRDEGLVDVRLIEVRVGPDGRPALEPALEALKIAGIARILVEGGGQVAASFLRAGLVDHLEWFRAPIVLGAEGRPCLGGLAIAALVDAPRFRRVSMEALGSDLWERYERA